LICKLHESQYQTNIAAGEGKSSSSHALCIVIYDDGSSCAGGLSGSVAAFNNLQPFHEPEELCDYLIRDHDALLLPD